MTYGDSFYECWDETLELCPVVLQHKQRQESCEQEKYAHKTLNIPVIWYSKGYGRGLAEGVVPGKGGRSWPGLISDRENLRPASTGALTLALEDNAKCRSCVPELDRFLRNASPENVCAAAKL